MAESFTPRLNLPRWTAGTDTLNRGELDGAMAELEARGARFGHGQLDARPAAAAANAGMVWIVNSTAGTVPGRVGAAYYSDGATWHHLNPPKTLRLPHTWHVPGEVKVPSGDTDYIGAMYVPEPAGQTVTLYGFRYRITSGTSATFRLETTVVSPITGASGIVANTTHQTTILATPYAFADLEAVSPVIEAVSGTPRNLYLTLLLDYTV